MRQLARDRWFILASCLVVVPVALYAWPPVRASAFPAQWAGSFADPCFLVLAIATLLASRRATAQREESRFWALVLATCACWLAGNAVAFGQPVSDVETPSRLIRDILYMASYVTLILAADLRPHLPGGWTRTTPGFPLTVAATLLCVLGIVVCFFALPMLRSPAAGWGWPALITFLALDVLVVIRFVHLLYRASGTPWAAVYGCFVFSSVAAATADGLNLLLATHRLKLDYGTPLDAVWWLPLVGFIAARRLRSGQVDAGVRALPAGDDEPRTDAIELLFLYALAFPAMYLTLAGLGLLSASDPATNLLVLAALIAFVSLAVAQQRLLERRNRELRSQLRVLVTNEQVLQSQRLEAIGRLAGGLSHDFNNLLTVVLGRAEMLLGSLAPGEQKQDVEEIRGAAQRGAALTRQLLAFSRNQIAQVHSMDLNAAVHEAESMLRRLAGERYAIAIDLGPGLHPIEADASQILQVLLNVVANARDAMPDGGAISIRTYETQVAAGDPGVVPPSHGGTYVAIDVVDTGTGIDAETQRRMFDPFFTNKVGGTGLGLAVVYGIVAKASGHLRVRSAVGSGTTFTAMFPCSDRPVSRLDPPARVAERGVPVQRTVLLVEDQGPVRASARGMLAVLGYHVLEAADGAEALELCREAGSRPDILLTDVVMPGMRGPEVATRVRELHPAIRVVFMSGFADRAADDVIARAVRARFIAKPFTLEQLGATLADGSPG